MEGKGRFFTGAIIGAALGGATAMLFCTKSGQKLKDKMMKNVDFEELLEMGASKFGLPDLGKLTGKLTRSKVKHRVKRAVKKAIHKRARSSR